MTFYAHFDDWPNLHLVDDSFNHCSPNLLAILEELHSRYGMGNLGCFGARPIRGGTTPSTHSWGAAIDVTFGSMTYAEVLAGPIPFLIGWSAELHLQALHDYIGCRIWHAGRTADIGDACDKWWKAQRPSSETGMGQPWGTHLHLETSLSGWADTLPVDLRGVS